ncbi:hypothetical protein ICN48_08035 [Polynucleobacter sp. JS-Safj-400b-B2]|nr:hypothetical protein [Polynucleobacter sp. JS-Safj-400b-B2]
MQYEENFLLPIFIKHYSQFFPLNSIYVIDHGSSDNFVPEGVNRIYIPRDRDFSENDRLSLVKNIADGLLKYYDYGIYADCDELIALDYFNESDLADYPVVYVCGFDCYPGVLDGSERILGLAHSGMCKPLIFKEVPNWSNGFHFSDKHSPQLELSIPMAHVRYLFPSQISKRVEVRKRVYSSLIARERDEGFDMHWHEGDKTVSEFFEYSTMLEQKNTQISLFSNFERNRLFNERASQGVFVKHSFYVPKADYKLLEERFDLTDIFPRLLD